MEVADSDSASYASSRASTPSDRKKHKRKRDLYTLSLDDQEEIVTYTDNENGVTYKAGGSQAHSFVQTRSIN